MNKYLTIINRTKFKTKDIEEIALALLAGQLTPNFYLICEDANSCNGISLTNLDRPTMIIMVADLGQFAKTFVHELVHLQQHMENYVDEKEVKKREIVVSDDKNPFGLTIHNCDFKVPPKLSQICKCGHDWNFHNVLHGEACHEMDCKCSKFELTS